MTQSVHMIVCLLYAWLCLCEWHVHRAAFRLLSVVMVDEVVMCRVCVCVILWVWGVERVGCLELSFKGRHLADTVHCLTERRPTWGSNPRP